jgi:hypothetical protein
MSLIYFDKMTQFFFYFWSAASRKFTVKLKEICLNKEQEKGLSSGKSLGQLSSAFFLNLQL